MKDLTHLEGIDDHVTAFLSALTKVMPPVRSSPRKRCWCHPGCGLHLSGRQRARHYRKAVELGLQADIRDSKALTGQSDPQSTNVPIEGRSY